MSKEPTNKMGSSSCSDSVSFPNTIMQSKPLEMGSTVFRFKPIRSDVLLKQLLEDEEEFSKDESKSSKQKQIHRGNDSFSSDEDTDQNILDKTITQDDSVLNSKNVESGVSWLDSSPDRKPLKIIAKHATATPMTNMFSKLSIRDPISVRKELRSVSVDRKDEPKLPQTPANNGIFKTPVCKNSRNIPHSSAAQKLYSSDHNALLSTNIQLLSTKKGQLEIMTPKQKIPVQPNRILETPRNSILQAAIRRNFNTPLPTSSTTKDDSIISSSAKKSDVVLREKNLNIGLQRQMSREVINEEKQLLSKQSTNRELKYVPNKQSHVNEIKKPLNSTNRELKYLPNKQPIVNEIKKTINHNSGLNSNKQSDSEIKHSSISEARQLPNSNEFKQSSINEVKQLPNKQLNINEHKQSDVKHPNVQLAPAKSLQESAFHNSGVNEARQLPNKQSNSNEFKQSSINEVKQLQNKQLNSNEYKQSDVKHPHVQITPAASLQESTNNNSGVNEARQNSNKQSNSNEFKQSSINEVKQLPNKQLNSNEYKQSDVKQPHVQISIPAKSLQESTFQQLKVKGKDYIVINKIGEGGSGQVYRCLEQETLQDRAIKVVNLNVDLVTRNSFINEVKMLKELQGNDKVIRMYDFEQVNQNLFVVMEKGDVDFSIFLRNITSQPQTQTHIIICYWIEMLKCVREIHEQGIIHSDLKPSNFLLVGGRLKLIDFGIASRLNADMTSVIKNVTVGTFNYISPEALLDCDGSPRMDKKPQLRISYKSDVWSLGCILYQMVYRKTPFQTIGSIYAKFAKITDRNHQIEYQKIPGVPLYLIDMIKKCLVYDMRSRPTVEELLNMYYSGNYY